MLCVLCVEDTASDDDGGAVGECSTRRRLKPARALPARVLAVGARLLAFPALALLLGLDPVAALYRDAVFSAASLTGPDVSPVVLVTMALSLMIQSTLGALPSGE